MRLTREDVQRRMFGTGCGPCRTQQGLRLVRRPTTWCFLRLLRIQNARIRECWRWKSDICLSLFSSFFFFVFPDFSESDLSHSHRIDVPLAIPGRTFLPLRKGQRKANSPARSPRIEDRGSRIEGYGPRNNPMSQLLMRASRVSPRL